jgi:thiamine kinase-like enzyme
MIDNNITAYLKTVLKPSSGELQLKKIVSGTNKCYKVISEGKSYHLRINGKNSELLGINRSQEFEVITLMADAQICPKIVSYNPKIGVLLSEFVEGKQWDEDQFSERDNIKKILEVVRKVHSIKVDSDFFNPFAQTLKSYNELISKGVVFPHFLKGLIKQVMLLEKEEWVSDSQFMGFCHNDLTPENFLVNSKIWLLDWEFSSNGNVFYDLATMSVYLPQRKKKFVVENYFGYYNIEMFSRLLKMEVVVNVWNALWAVNQIDVRKDVNYRYWADYYLFEAREKKKWEKIIYWIVPKRFFLRAVRTVGNWFNANEKWFWV